MQLMVPRLGCKDLMVVFHIWKDSQKKIEGVMWMIDEQVCG